MKKFIALLLALVMVLSMTACGAKAPEAAPAPAPEAAAPEAAPEAAPAEEKEEVSIEVWIAQVDWADAWDEMEAKFEAEYPYIDVQHVGLGEDANQFLATKIAANDLPDVIQCNNTANMDAMVAGDMLVDLSDYACAANMGAAYADAFTHNGKLVGMCQGSAFSCMFYNMAILNEAGWTEAPTTWDELLQCCADIEAKTDAAPLVTAAGKHTTAWMIVELILADLLGDPAAVAAYQDDFKNGTFDFKAVDGLAERLDAITPYFLEGSASAQEEDASMYMADGSAAMCLAGNWNGAMISDAIAEQSGDVANAKASLPPFGGFISNSPEDAFCITVDANRSAAEQEAVDTFFEWIFIPENFALIQNARATVPVLTNMPAELIKLPECMVPVAADVASANAVLMGFNLYSAEFRDIAIAKIQDMLNGAATGADFVAACAEALPTTYKNQ